jgi:hypothetical protein
MRIRNRSSRIALRCARLKLLCSTAWLASQPAHVALALERKLGGDRSVAARTRLPRDYSSSVWGSVLSQRSDGIVWAPTKMYQHIIDMRVRGEITYEEQREWIEQVGWTRPAPPTNLYA